MTYDEMIASIREKKKFRYHFNEGYWNRYGYVAYFSPDWLFWCSVSKRWYIHRPRPAHAPRPTILSDVIDLDRTQFSTLSAFGYEALVSLKLTGA